MSMSSGPEAGGKSVLRIAPGRAETHPEQHARRQRAEELALAFATPVIFLVLWEVAAQAGVMDRRFFPAPTEIFKAAMDMVEKGILWKDLVASTYRIVGGFALGTVAGVLAALWLGLSRLARAALDPFLSALYTVPKLALLPLLLLIFGLGEFPKILLVALTVFFLVWITCMEAIMTIPESYREAARSFGASGWAMFRHVTWPAMLSQLFVAMRLAIGTAVLVIVGIEFVQASEGVGYRIWHSWSLFQANRMYVGLCVVALMGFGFGVLVRWIGYWALPWLRRGPGKG